MLLVVPEIKVSTEMREKCQKPQLPPPLAADATALDMLVDVTVYSVDQGAALEDCSKRNDAKLGVMDEFNAQARTANKKLGDKYGRR